MWLNILDSLTSKDFLKTMLSLTGLAICISLLFLIFNWTEKDSENCKKSCGVYRYCIIEGQCHCAKLDGWERKDIK